MDNWQDIRQKARETRALLGAHDADAPARDVLNHLLRHWDLELDELAPDHPLLRGARAAWRENYGLVLVDRTLSAPERAFAIAHELGHRVCHPGGCACTPEDIDDATLPVGLPLGEGRVWGYNPRQAREVEANVFAAELLAPAAALRARFMDGQDYRALADRYGVTPTCALNGLIGAVLGGTAPSPPAHADWSLSAPLRQPTRLSPCAGEGSLLTDKQSGRQVGVGHDTTRQENSPSPYPQERGMGGEGVLDESQRRAAEIDAPRALVDAGPGTGKTRTLVARTLHLINQGATTSEILVLTFSNRAADELRQRLRMAGPETAGVTITTFHGYALDVLRRFAPQAGLPDGFRVVDDVDAAIMLEEALPGLKLERYTHLARPTLYLPALLAAASRMRDSLLTPADLAAHGRDGAFEEAEPGALDETLRLLAAYDGLLAARGLVDYGGLITRAVALLQSDPAVAATVKAGLRHVLVDEYQDVNRASAVLLRELVAGAAALWVVGDARQSIYRFRGAEPRNITRFEEDFPGAVRLSLEVNYRTTPTLVGAITNVAQEIITTDSESADYWAGDSGSAGVSPVPASAIHTTGTGETPALPDNGRTLGMVPPWTAWRPHASNEDIILAVAPDEVAERAGLVADITRSIAEGRRPEDHAVLCRTHRQAAEVAAALETAGLPTSYLGALFLRSEVKDLLALLELCRGLDGSALLRLATWPEYRLDHGRVMALIAAARVRNVPFPAALRDADVLDTANLTDEEHGRLARLHAHVEAVRYYPDPSAVLLHYLFGEAPYLRRLLHDESPPARQAASAIFQLIVLARGFMVRPLAAPGDNATGAFLHYVRRLLAEGETAVAQTAAPVPGAVNVLTVHGSKGLEFPVVYVPNLAKGRFPPRARGGVTVALPPQLERDPVADAAEEYNLFFVAVSRARDRLVLSRAARYGGRNAAPSELLATLRRSDVREIVWPAVEPLATVTTASDPQAALPTTHDSRLTTQGAMTTASDLQAMLRCPSLYDYRRAGLRGDDAANGYRLFARLLREGVARLRAAHGAAWPASAPDAEREFAQEWDKRWPPDGALGEWYRTVATRAIQRAYHELAHPDATADARYAQQHTISLDGHTVDVTLDAVEMVDGAPTLVLERATRRSDDATSAGVALYAAAARSLAPDAPPQVLIRYLDSGETRAVPDPARVLAKHGPRLRQALDRLARNDYPSSPHDDAECARCPLVFVCPR